MYYLKKVEKYYLVYVREAKFSFVTENILSHTCVILKSYDAIYSVVYVLESNAY